MASALLLPLVAGEDLGVSPRFKGYHGGLDWSPTAGGAKETSLKVRGPQQQEPVGYATRCCLQGEEEWSRVFDREPWISGRVGHSGRGGQAHQLCLPNHLLLNIQLDCMSQPPCHYRWP